jgi:hypothetical protein
VITTYEKPVQEKAGFLVLKGNLFDFAIMKTSVISPEFRKRYLGKGDSFECRAVVFDGSTDYHDRINDPSLGIDENTILVIRGSGRWAGRLGRGREHAAAGCAAQARHHEPADARRRPAVRHLRQSVDPQLLAGERRGRRPGVAAHGRPHPHRPRRGHL